MPQVFSSFFKADGYAWAGNMKRLLQQTCMRVSKRKYLQKA
jgi:hypothetical protein